MMGESCCRLPFAQSRHKSDGATRHDISFSAVAADIAAGFQIHLCGTQLEPAPVPAALKKPRASLPRTHPAALPAFSGATSTP
jgi:hypothetical protein